MYIIPHKNSFSLLVVTFLIFATQSCLTKQANTTSLRPQGAERLLASSYAINCTTSCSNSYSLNQSTAIYNVIIGPNSQANLGFNYVDGKWIIINLNPQQSIDYTIDVLSIDQGSSIQANYEMTAVPISYTTSDINEVLVSLSNPNNMSTTVAITISYIDNQNVLYSPSWIAPLGAGAGGLIFLTILGTVCCLRHADNRRQRERHMPLPFPVTLEKRQVNVNESFPEKKFEELKSSFPQKTCSICLEDLQEAQLCRQLDCQHIFHSECGKLWLETQLLKKNKASCPNCNQIVLTTEPKKV